MSFSYKAIAASGCFCVFFAGCTNNTALIRPGATAGMLELVNASPHTLSDVTITQCAATVPGPSRLNAAEVVAPAATRRWALSEGCYDVRTGYDGPAGTGFSESQVHIGAERVYTLTVRQ